MTIDEKIELARAARDHYRDYIETLPAYIYNNNIEKYQGRLEKLDQELDALIDEKYSAHPVAEAYEMEKALDAWQAEWRETVEDVLGGTRQF